jgi:hypothetical protein
VTGKFSLLMYVVLQIIFHSCKLFSKKKEIKRKERKNEKKKNKIWHKRKLVKPHAIMMT